VSDLETERDQLRELARAGEATVVELRTTVDRLRSAEKSTSDEVARLRAKNDWMAGRIDGLLELVGRLEDADRAHRAAAGELRLRAERHSAAEVRRSPQMNYTAVYVYNFISPFLLEETRGPSSG